MVDLSSSSPGASMRANPVGNGEDGGVQMQSGLLRRQREQDDQLASLRLELGRAGEALQRMREERARDQRKVEELAANVGGLQQRNTELQRQQQTAKQHLQKLAQLEANEVSWP